MQYPSKIDWWAWPLFALLILAIPGCLVAAYFYFPHNPTEAWIFLGTSLLMPLFIFLLLWPIHYTLTEDKLIVRFGLFRYRIPYDNITEVYPTHNPLSSPAWSLDRLCIERTKGLYVLISPKDKEKFLADLAQRHPDLTLEGDRLLRR